MADFYEQAKQQVVKQRQALDAWETSCAEADTALQKMEKDLGQHQSILAGLEQKLASAETELTTAEGVLQQKRDLAENSQLHLQAAITGLGQEELTQLQTELQQKDKAYEQAKTRAEQLEQQLEQLREELAAVRSEGDLKAQLAALDSSLKEAQERLAAVKQELAKVTGGLPAQDLIK